MKKIDAERFGQWLTAQNYAEQTVRSTLMLYRRLAADLAAGVPAEKQAQPYRLVPLLRIVAGSADAEAGVRKDVGAYAQEVVTILRDKKRPKGLRGGKKSTRRVKEARSVPDDSWPKLVAWLVKDEALGARVLEVQASTGLRIGDILRIELGALRKGVASGVLDLTQKGDRERVLAVRGSAGEDAWRRLLDATDAGSVTRARLTVARAISGSDDATSSGAAYAQCQRVLKRASKELGIEHLHTHRLRRTMAVQALRLTGDIPAVQEMIGHAPGSPATMKYLDEARAGDVAKLSKRVAETFAKGRST